MTDAYSGGQGDTLWWPWQVPDDKADAWGDTWWWSWMCADIPSCDDRFDSWVLGGG